MEYSKTEDVVGYLTRLRDAVAEYNTTKSRYSLELHGSIGELRDKHGFKKVGYDYDYNNMRNAINGENYPTVEDTPEYIHIMNNMEKRYFTMKSWAKGLSIATPFIAFFTSFAILFTFQTFWAYILLPLICVTIIPGLYLSMVVPCRRSKKKVIKKLTTGKSAKTIIGCIQRYHKQLSDVIDNSENINLANEKKIKELADYIDSFTAIHDDYKHLSTLNILIQYFKHGRVGSLKEAVNLYVDEAQTIMHRKALEQQAEAQSRAAIAQAHAAAAAAAYAQQALESQKAHNASVREKLDKMNN